MNNYKYFITSIILIAALGWPVSSWSRAFRDALGREIELEGSPKRIVVLAPSLAEIVYYLGLGDSVVGVTDFSYYPPEALEKPTVGSYVDPNVERIISLSPDLVIGTKDGNMPGSVYPLEQAGIPVYIVNPRNVKDIITTIETISELCGIPERSRQLINGLNRRLEAVRAAIASVEKPLVFLQINISPIMTVNKNSFHNDIIKLAGGINMTADEPVTYPKISIEEVISKRPDIILISSMERGRTFHKAREEWMKWMSIPAVKDNRVYLIDSDLIDRPSQRIIDGLEAMARLIHPEVDWNNVLK
jgi:iron complex transport system substrate-binding protein